MGVSVQDEMLSSLRGMDHTRKPKENMADWVTEQYLVMLFINNTTQINTLDADSPEDAVKKIKHEKLSAANLEQMTWIRAIKIEDIPEVS